MLEVRSSILRESCREFLGYSPRGFLELRPAKAGGRRSLGLASKGARSMDLIHMIPTLLEQPPVGMPMWLVIRHCVLARGLEGFTAVSPSRQETTKCQGKATLHSCAVPFRDVKPTGPKPMA